MGADWLYFTASGCIGGAGRNLFTAKNAKHGRKARKANTKAATTEDTGAHRDRH
jgi:hypothetical protein